MDPLTSDQLSGLAPRTNPNPTAVATPDSTSEASETPLLDAQKKAQEEAVEKAKAKSKEEDVDPKQAAEEAIRNNEWPTTVPHGTPQSLANEPAEETEQEVEEPEPISEELKDKLIAALLAAHARTEAPARYRTVEQAIAYFEIKEDPPSESEAA